MAAMGLRAARGRVAPGCEAKQLAGSEPLGDQGE